jgi:nitrogen fixation/metabolism regulation signal transduction histidine kinase
MNQMEATQFAPAERLGRDELAGQAADLSVLDLLAAAFEAVNDLVVVLNAQRQIIYANRNTLALLGAPGLDSVLGQRPGEAIGCVHACQSPGGCGTSKFCSTCGAVNAILTAQSGRPDCRECRILRQGGDALDLLVRTTPLTAAGCRYTICTISDISHEKRRHALERIFFHDVLNTASGVLMFSSRVAQGPADPAIRVRLHELVAQLVDEIVAQRDLMAAETSDLAVCAKPFSTREFLEGLVQLYANSPACANHRLALGQCHDLIMCSDRRLLGRVLGNLVKNALEAAPENTTVEVAMTLSGDGVEFSVHNDGVIPPEVQLQLFQRSFSTKGTGRGLGTYSVKLLTDRYLAGRVSVASDPRAGTVFRAWYPLKLDVPTR